VIRRPRYAQVNTLAVITPSYGPDAVFFADLHESVLEFTPSDTVHHVIVPRADRHLFARYAGPRCRIRVVNEFIPRRFLKVPRLGLWANLLRPWPPVRGWVMQQIIKLAATASSDADVVLVADSDVVLVRPTDASRAFVDGGFLLHRLENGVLPGMDRHVVWHQTARKLLKLPPAPGPPLPDYMSPLTFWDPANVRALQRHLTETTGRHWADAFGSHLHVSEFMLYGVFVDEVLCASGVRPPSDTTICHKSPDESPMTMESAAAFVDRLPPTAMGVLISSKSGTPHEVRQAAIKRCREVAAG